MKNKILVSMLALSFMFGAASAAEPSHPLSQIDPIDEALNLEGQDILSVDQLRFNDSGTDFLVIEDNKIRDSSGAYVLRLDRANGQWEVVGADLSLESNNIDGTGSVNFDDANGDGAVFNLGERSGTGNLVVRNTNTGTNVYAIDSNGNIDTMGQFTTGAPVEFNDGINASFSKIFSLQDPSNAQDAATKGYVDSSDDTIADDQNLQDVLAIGNSAGSYTVDMNGNDILNPGLVDGVNLQTPGNAIGIDGSNQYYIPSNAIGNNEIGNSGSFTFGGITNNGQLDQQSNRIVDLADPSNAQDAATKSYVDGSDDTIADDQNWADVLSRGNSAGTYNADMNGNNILNPNLVDGVDLDSTGNALTIDSNNNYAVASGSIDDNEIADNTIDNSEIQNGASFTVGGLTSNGQINTNGNTLNLDSGDQYITIHDGNGNFNIKSGVDPSNTIVAGSGGTHVRLDESGGFDVSVDESTSSGNAMGEDVGFAVNGGSVDVRNGNLDMGSNRIVNAADPTNSQDLATKSYVDSSDDTISDNQNLADVLSRGNSAGSYTIDMNGNSINNIGGLQGCTSDQFVNGNGNCVNHYDSGDDGDTSSTNEFQDLGYSNDNAPTGSYATHTVTLTDGSNTGIRDYYDPNTDSQSLSNVLSQGNSAGGTSITNGAICPDGTCDKSNYETFDSSGIGTSNIYDGSGGEVDFQSQVNFNGNNVKNINAQSSFRLPVGTDAY